MISSPPPSSKVLVVDDDPILVRLVSQSLRDEGLQVISAENGLIGLRRVYADRPDVVILDVMMPEMDGWEMLQQLRELGNQIPIVMLSAKGDLEDRLQGLTLGADDYVPKPFDMEELMLRVRNLLRRSQVPVQKPAHWRFDDGYLSIDLVESSITRQGQPVNLTRIEWDLLACLLQKAPKVVLSTELMVSAWRAPAQGSPTALKVHIRHLRQKLEPEPDKPVYILTHRTVGYRFGGHISTIPEEVNHPQ